jgi:ubiquinone/menaquinone biosynthesis C-methylase UbiE
MLTRVLEPEVMDTADEAADYDAMDHAEVNRRFVDDLLSALTAAHAGRPLRILDVGTGTALIPIELCRRTAGIHVTGIDLADEMLKLGRTNVAAAGLADRIELKLVDAKGLGLPERSFDAVMSNSIVHHIPEPAGVFREMVHVLQPGGLLFVRDLLRPESAEEVERFVGLYTGGESEQQRQLFRQSLHAALSLEEVRAIVGPLGIGRDEVKQTSDRHWTVVAKPQAK